MADGRGGVRRMRVAWMGEDHRTRGRVRLPRCVGIVVGKMCSEDRPRREGDGVLDEPIGVNTRSSPRSIEGAGTKITAS